jgi:hypothetical protein
VVYGAETVVQGIPQVSDDTVACEGAQAVIFHAAGFPHDGWVQFISPISPGEGCKSLGFSFA